MDLLFKREQTSGAAGRVKFKLWGKVELDEDEKKIVSRYNFDQAVLIAAFQPTLIRKSGFVGGGAFLLSYAVVSVIMNSTFGLIVALIAGASVGYWYFNERRETIFVSDLIHGRYFTCDSVIDLARKEAWLQTVSSFLRQVMESAKHWDGTERHTIEPLPKDEARQIIIKGI